MSQKNKYRNNLYGVTPVTVDSTSDIVEQQIDSGESDEEIIVQPIEVNNITNPIPPEPIGEFMSTPQEPPVQPMPLFLIGLNAYVQAMQQGSGIDTASGGMEQYKLWMVIKSIIGQEDDQAEFNARWTILLDFVSKYRNTVFSEGQLYRFPDAWYGSPSEFNAYRRVMYLIANTCDPSTRSEKLKYIDLRIVLSEGLTEEEKNKINNYY